MSCAKQTCRAALLGPLSTGAVCIAVFFAGMLLAFLLKRRGMLLGFAQGAAFFAIILIAALLQGTMQFSALAFVKLIAFCAAGGIGGYFGILLAEKNGENTDQSARKRMQRVMQKIGRPIRKRKEVFGLKKRQEIQNRPAIRLIFALYYLGLVLGALYASAQSGKQESYLYYYVNGFLERHTNGSFLSVFSLSFLALWGCTSFYFCAVLPVSECLLFYCLLCCVESAEGIGAFLYLDMGKGDLFQVLIC